MKPSQVWIVGGYDPSGCAGVLVDHRTLEAFGASYASLITALTAQNTTECSSINSVDPTILQKQAESLVKEQPPAFMKIGLIPSIEVLEFLTVMLDEWCPISTLDPVIQTSSGKEIIDARLLKAIKKELLPKTALITPNRQEAEIISGVKISKSSDYLIAAKVILDMGAKAVLIKDGHGTGDWCCDYFIDTNRSFWVWTPRIRGKSVRGTGCCVASAIAAAWSDLGELSEAVIIGSAYVQRAIRHASPHLYHAPWPVEHQDMPRVTNSIDQQPLELDFPECNASFYGYYPIVSSADWIASLVEWQAPMAQLRIKQHHRHEIKRAIQIAKDHCYSLFINDYWETALNEHAYGVHLGQDDVLEADVFRLANAEIRLGISTHSYEELARALSYNPSYIALGPIFPTITKKMPWKPQGIQRISIWKQLSGKPLVAIGGLTFEDAHDVWDAGADAVSFVRELTEAKYPRNIIKKWNEEVNRCRLQKLNMHAIQGKSTCRVSL